MLKFNSVSSDGELSFISNQKLFYPENTNAMNYSQIFNIKMISSKNGKIITANQGSVEADVS